MNLIICMKVDTIGELIELIGELLNKLRINSDVFQ